MVSCTTGYRLLTPRLCRSLEIGPLECVILYLFDISRTANTESYGQADDPTTAGKDRQSASWSYISSSFSLCRCAP